MVMLCSRKFLIRNVSPTIQLVIRSYRSILVVVSGELISVKSIILKFFNY